MNTRKMNQRTIMTSLALTMAALTSAGVCWADKPSVSVAGKPMSPIFATARPKGDGWKVTIRDEKEPCTGFFMGKGSQRIIVVAPNKVGKAKAPEVSFFNYVDNSDEITPGGGSLTVKTLSKTTLTIVLDIKAEDKTRAKQNFFKGTITADICGPE
jgi:hypothetical protein